MMISRQQFLSMDIVARFKYTMYVVEATDFEQHALYLQHVEYPQNTLKISWVHISNGSNITIGKIGDDPVCVSFRWAIINQVPVMFYEPTSVMVDWDMVKEYIESKCNPFVNGSPARTNARNFHHVIHASDAMKDILEKTLEKDPIL